MDGDKRSRGGSKSRPHMEQMAGLGTPTGLTTVTDHADSAVWLPVVSLTQSIALLLFVLQKHKR